MASPASGIAACRSRAALAPRGRTAQVVGSSLTFAAVTTNSPVLEVHLRAAGVHVLAEEVPHAAPRREVAHAVRVLQDAADDVAFVDRLQQRLARVEPHHQHLLVQPLRAQHVEHARTRTTRSARRCASTWSLNCSTSGPASRIAESRVAPAYLSVETHTASGQSSFTVSSNPFSRCSVLSDPTA